MIKLLICDSLGKFCCPHTFQDLGCPSHVLPIVGGETRWMLGAGWWGGFAGKVTRSSLKRSCSVSTWTSWRITLTRLPCLGRSRGQRKTDFGS